MATPKLLLVPNRYKSGVLYSQLPESGAGDFAVVRATTATRVNASGLLESVASGVPRLDFGVSGCPVLLVEASGTNVLTWSEDLTNANWGKIASSISANATTAPNDTLTADKIVEDSSTGLHHIQQSFSHTSGLVYTISFFAEAAERTAICLQAGTSFNDNLGNVGQYVDLTNGQPLNALSGVTVKTQLIGGFYRICITTTAASTATSNFFILLAIGTSASYTGDGTSGLFVWGADLKQGAPSSYIPTTAAAATRNADVMTVEPPVGTTLITTTFEDDTTQEIVPSGTFTIPNGRIKSIVMT